jgi:hypothetical protein
MWTPFGSWRRMPSSPGFTCPMLHPTLPAMPVQCTMTCPPDASGISCSGLLFFYEAQISRRDLEPKSLV